MSTVNIRIVPINGIHRGGLAIMSAKETHDTGKEEGEGGCENTGHRRRHVGDKETLGER